MALVVKTTTTIKKKKNPPTDAGDIRDVSLIPKSEIPPRGGHGNPRQYSCLENPMDREAWRATAHEVAKTERVHTRAHTHTDMLKVKVKATQLCPTLCDPMSMDMSI